MRRAAVMCLPLLLAACAAPPPAVPDVAQVREAIEQVNAQFMEAFNKGDAEAVASHYTEDALVCPPGTTLQSGRAAIRSDLMSNLPSMPPHTLKLTTDRVEVYGPETAAETGTYAMSLRPSDGPQVDDRGKYLVIWKKQADGSWKLHWDIWNSDLPPPAAAAEPVASTASQ